MPITDNAPQRNPPSRTVELEDQDFEIQNMEEIDQVDANFNNIALRELEGANDPDGQAQKEDQADNANVDCLVTVLVRAVELLSELSCCQSYFQSCCQSSAAVRATVRVVVKAQPLSAAVRATVRSVVRAQPLSEY
jgi:hypothetical protein